MLASSLNWTNGQMMQFKEQKCRFVVHKQQILEKGYRVTSLSQKTVRDTAESRREWGPQRGPMLTRWNQDFNLKGDKTEQSSESSSRA